MDNTITIKESFLVVLDSRNATSKYNSSWNSSVNFEFEDPIKKDDYTIQMTCSILNFSMANSIYNINETNNFLTFDILNPFKTFNIYIPYGTYNFHTLKSVIDNLHDSNIELTLDLNSNIITLLDKTSPFIIGPESTLLNILGGINGQMYGSTTQNENIETVIFPFQCNFNGVNNLNIFMSNIKTRNIDSFSKSNSSLIQSIQINPYSPQIVFNRTNDYSFNINQSIINDIQIDIKDDLNNYINFNNQSWNLTLCFNVLKDTPRFIEDNFHHILFNGYQ